MALHVDELVNIDVSVGESLAGMSTGVYHVIKPDGTLATWTAALNGDVADGNLRYATQVDDLDQPGMYAMHAFVTFANGQILTGDKVEFQVYSQYHPH